MKRLLGFVLLMSLNAHAGILDTVCESAMYLPPKFTDGFVAQGNQAYRLDGREFFSTSGNILSMVADGEKLWVLTQDRLIELSHTAKVLSESDIYGGKTLAISNDSLYIVRGDGVVMSLSKKDKSEEWNTRLSEVKGGKALGASFDGKNLQVFMTSTFEGGFNGIATLDAHTGKFISKAGYNYVSAGVIDPEVNGKWSQGTLILNNGGWIHLISAAQLSKGKTFRPVWKAVAEGSGRDLRYMMLKGEFYIDGKNLIGCGFTSGQMKLYKVPVL